MRWLLPVVLILVLAISVPLPAVGQPIKEQAEQQIEISTLSEPEPDTVVSTLFDGKGNMVFNTTTSTAEEVDVILELKEKPTLVLQAELERGPLAPIMRAVGVNGMAIKDQGMRFAAEQAQTIRAMNVMVQAEPKASYSKVFNGVATRVPAHLVGRLEKLPNVKKVWPDVKVEMFLNESVPIIAAEDVWEKTDSAGRSITGQNVVIAVIDSGIDYTHADLGSCTRSQMINGNCAKIPYGYDFFNNDTDPMDDNGHGTHVASTAAGTGAASGGKFKGVAPDAKLLAYKVMSKEGWGSTSDIITAVENATAWGTDIISLSLGGPGDADSPLSVAVDNAVDAGVVVVVAAGNSGPRSESIGAPGSSEKAITVGAVDKYGHIASFSSRGPVYSKEGISSTKPDVAAPGVDVCAARASDTTLGGTSNLICGDDRYIALSGTSMDTPHVSGAAALLIQEHPDWNPVQVKSALMGTASLSRKAANTYGAGLINSLSVHESPVIFSTDNVPLINQYDSGTWSGSKTFTVVNKGSKEAKFTISTDFDSELSASTINEISVGAGQSRTFTVSVSMDSSMVEDGWYYGIVTASNDDTVLSLPMGVAKSNPIELSMDNTTLLVLIVEDGDVKFWAGYPPQKMVRLLPDGDYSVLWMGEQDEEGAFYWVGKDFHHAGSTMLTLDRQIAKNRVELAPVKEDGKTFINVSRDCRRDAERPCYLGRASHLGVGGIEMGILYGDPNASIPNYVSDLPPGANWSETVFIEDEGKLYRFDFSKREISSDTRLTNSPGDLVDVELSYRVLGAPYRVVWSQLSSYSAVTYAGSPKKIRDGFKEHFLATRTAGISRSGKSATAFSVFQSVEPEGWVRDFRLKTPNIEVRGPTDFKGEWAWDIEAETGVVEKKKAIGSGAPCFVGEVYSGYNLIGVFQWPSSLCSYFATDTGDLRWRLISPFYELWDAETGKTVGGGSLNCNNWGTLMEAEDGKYWLVIKESGYPVGGTFAQTTVNASFTKGAADPNPPLLRYLRVIVDKEAVNMIPGGKNIKIEAKVLDDTEVSKVRFAYSKDGISWKEVIPIKSGTVWRASVSGLADGRYKLRFIATDSAGNSLEQLQDPGFEIVTDKKAPQWLWAKTGPEDLVYHPEGISYFNSTWLEDTRLADIILELDGKNLTDIKMEPAEGLVIAPPIERLHGALGAQLVAMIPQPEYYKQVVGLSAGNHSYRWYASDFAGNWNATPVYTYEVLAAPPPVCGNGEVEIGEECDDGNTVKGDGCSENCMNETVCGNGVIEGDEECDDGNNLDGDDCGSDCKLEAVCGNGIVEVNEECDDGNTVKGDGCSDECRWEAVILAACGNGMLEAGEECDDGNIISGDGCSADCKIEAPPIVEDAEAALAAANKEIAEAAAAGTDVSEAEILLEDARQSFAAGDYERTIELAQAARQAIAPVIPVPKPPPLIQVEWIAAALTVLGVVLGIAFVVKKRKAPAPEQKVSAPKRKGKKKK